MNRKTLLLTVAIAGSAVIGSVIVVGVQERNLKTVKQEEILVGNESPFITEFPVPIDDAGVNAIAADNNGLIWFIENNSSKIASFDPVIKQFREYCMPEEIGFVWSMVVDDKNRVWFIDAEKDKLWMLDQESKYFENFELPSKGSFPLQMAIDTIGNLWFTEFLAGNRTGNKIAKFDPVKKEFAEYRTLTPESGPIGIDIDHQGNIWFTEIGRIGVFFPSNSSFKEYEFPRPIIPPTGLVVDNDGTVWFTQHGGNKIGKFIPSNKTLIEYSTLSLRKENPATLPYWIKKDMHNNLWFNQHTGNRIAKFIASNETLIEYHIPSKDIVDALTFTIDNDGNVWFTELGANKIGFVNTTMPLPFMADASPKQVKIRPGEAAEVKLTLKNISPESYTSNLRFIATSTMTPLGKFVNASATFSPTTVSIDEKSRQVTLLIRTEATLVPSIYKVIAGATDGVISYLSTIDLIVEKNNFGKTGSGIIETIN